jgi:hypothetical protein
MSEMNGDILDGACCALCGVYFAEDNGYPVLCETCWKEHGQQARGHPPITTDGYQLTTEKEQ